MYGVILYSIVLSCAMPAPLSKCEGKLVHTSLVEAANALELEAFDANLVDTMCQFGVLDRHFSEFGEAMVTVRPEAVIWAPGFMLSEASTSHDCLCWTPWEARPSWSWP